ncbi:hypothetical protein SDRG_17416 [Saprolegnia diclina VS20]|uniref:Uncharacterized protein n=1 Tax=Saprolegnia diclina (strain VS20) TaxID=1156394 RepID=T0PUL8_SAPDV|nr:hypothetical protein SDRG_17416 [Saprolegnia diclina VS20]EQC24690.1 hypothetical protein SDRG_17416 [Saprolegnia diclina VS20]|eukprot:XP_008621880.1 hypothetical protein SDRG_17416 [Saprolegnia diclina VS20]
MAAKLLKRQARESGSAPSAKTFTPSALVRMYCIRDDHIHVLTEVKREYENKVLELTNKLEVDLK